MKLRKLFVVYSLASLLIVSAGCNSRPSAAIPGSTTNPRTLDASSAKSAADESPIAVNQDALKADLYYLSSDRLEGRGISTQGLDLATDFIATRFQALGLKPLPGMDSYFQPFDIVDEQISPQSTLKMGDTQFDLSKKEFSIHPISAEKDFSAPVVFAGYAITAPSEHYDDFANVDVKDKVVLAMRFEPHYPKTHKARFGGDDWSKYSYWDSKAKLVAAQGAAALLVVNPPSYHFPGTTEPLVEFRKRTAGVSIPVLHISREVAASILKQGGMPDLKALEAQIDDTGKPASALLKGVTVSGETRFKKIKTPVRNVLAYLPGSGPNADEFVVVGAHCDHLGWGGPGSLMNVSSIFTGADPATKPVTTRPAAMPTDPHSLPTTTQPTTRAIHHGADDNGSGTVAMLELARLISQGPAPSRSIVFASFTAEEEGLIGSAHFVNHSPIDLKKIAAMVNLDMVGRVRHDVLYVGGSGTATPLEAIVAKADASSPLKFQDFGKGGLGPSDHMSFAQKKVPVLFLFSGNHADYHRPTDTADKINYAGMAQVVQMTTGLVNDLTHMPLSQYNSAADKGPMMNPMTAGREGSKRASLGIVPSYGGEEDGKGVKISGTTSGTAAEKAGLLEGDIVVSLNDRPTGTLMELSAVLASLKPAQRVNLTFIHAGKTITREIILGERAD